MNKIKFLTIITLAFFGLVIGQAAQAEGTYFSLKGGLNLIKDMNVANEFLVIQTFPTPDTPETFDFKKAFTGSIAFGKTFGRFRMETEGFYSNAKFDVIDTMAMTVASSGSIAALMVNGYIDLLEGGNGAPYFGFGLGFAETKLDAFTKGEGLAIQAIAGLKMNLTDNAGVGIEYRYFRSKSGGTFDNIKSSNVMVAFFYSF